MSIDKLGFLQFSSISLMGVFDEPRARSVGAARAAPSRADIPMAQAIIDVAKPLGIAVRDQIIVGKDGHTSLKGLKLIEARKMRRTHHIQRSNPL